ncbi:MAG TPA: beta-propeller fold lactonase family protein [Trichocoleus sp.]|jgi:YVTN family beta-propeller protein
MKLRLIISFVFVILLSIAIPTLAGQAPFSASMQDIPISSRDRVYTADQTSNTVSVHDPQTNKLLGVIRLGEALPDNLSPLYKGQLLVHGMGFSPDHQTLDVVSVGSNSVAFIDTQTNQVKHITYVGRSPHEAFFTPDGEEVWVTVRGEDYVSVLDGNTYEEKLHIPVGNGPGMTIFRPDGKYGFVCSSFTPETKVVEVKTHQIVANVPQASPFCPNIAATPDGKQVWFTLKDVGKTQVFSAEPPFNVISTLDTGPITNHVNFAHNQNGQFAYITIGGENVVKVYTTTNTPNLVTTIPVGDLPHGLWPSGDGTRMYVALENGTGMTTIDTLTNKVIATNPGGQSSQALVYVPNAVPQGDGLDNLTPLGDSGLAAHVVMGPPGSSPEQSPTTVSINNQGLIDLVEAAVTGLQPKQQYQLVLVERPTSPYGEIQPLETFQTNPAGAAVVNTVGPIKRIVADSPELQRRYLAIVSVGDPNQAIPVQVQLGLKSM